MSVIATDGVTIASDSQHGWTLEIFPSGTLKIWRQGIWVFGAVGGECDGEAFKEFTLEGHISDLGKIDKSVERPELDDSFIAIMAASKTCFMWEHKLRSPSNTGLPFAIGSGEHFAVGAMEVGASPEDAVKAAIRRSPTCGGEVTVLEL